MSASFEDHRDHLRGVAYRMLGSPSEADDAVQETWLRFDRAAPADVANLRGWLTTVVARICLDMLRARTARREDPLAPDGAGATVAAATAPEAEAERALADSVGLALLVVLDRLDPAERIAFVMHDLLAVPFDDIAAIVGRSPEATRQLASRARRRVQGAPPPEAELARQRGIVEAFIAALRGGDVEAMIAVLDPEVEVRGGQLPVRGARAWASGAVAFAKAMRFASVALVDGSVGLVMAPNGRLGRVLRFAFANDRIASVEIIAERDRLDALDIGSVRAVTPSIMYGTAWKEEATEACVVQALAAGFRAIDTANQRKHYDEAAVGRGIAKAALARDALFVQTKFTFVGGQDHRLPYDARAPIADQVAQSCTSSLAHLGVGYLDAMLLHGPTRRDGLGPDDVAAWRALEALVDAGRARAIGVSNVTASQVDDFAALARVPIAFVQNRCYANRGWDRDVRATCARRGILYQGFSLLTANRQVLADARVRAIAERRGATPAQIVFRFAQRVGMLPLSGTTDAGHAREDIAAAAIALDDAEVATIDALG